MTEIRPGTRVEAVRVNGETRQGYVLCRAECVAHIGTFWLVGDEAPRPAPQPKGRPRKGAAKPQPIKHHAFGMYAPEDLRVLSGRPRKAV